MLFACFVFTFVFGVDWFVLLLLWLGLVCD